MNVRTGWELFSPEIVLPPQFTQPRERSKPEKRLMLAVLEEAVNCFQRYAHDKGRAAQKLFKEAEAWILSTDRSWPYSFENICDVFDLDPSYIRNGLGAWKERSPEGRPKMSTTRGYEDRGLGRHKISHLKSRNPGDPPTSEEDAPL